jgi:hypothetical protein
MLRDAARPSRIAKRGERLDAGPLPVFGVVVDIALLGLHQQR